MKSKTKLVLGCVVGLGFLMIMTCCGGVGLMLGPRQAPLAETSSRTTESREPATSARSSKNPPNVTNAGESPKTSNKSVTTNKETHPVKDQLISYKIIKRDSLHKFKQSFDIQVDLVEGRLPNKKELEAVSAKLRDKSFDKTFVCFFLPGMQVDAGAFATAHHDPAPQPARMNWFMLPAKYKKLASAADAALIERDNGFPENLLGHWKTADGRRMIIRGNEVTHILPKRTYSQRVGRVEPIDGGYRVVVVENGNEFPQTWEVTEDQFSVTYPRALVGLLGSPYKRVRKLMRTWTDDTGKFTVKGEFVSYKNGKVLVRNEDGKEIEFPVVRLSEADKDFLRELFRERGFKASF